MVSVGYRKANFAENRVGQPSCFCRARHVRVRMLLWSVVLTIVAWALRPGSAIAQFITMPGGHAENYNNYAQEGYRNYSQDFLVFKQYDDFGNYLTEGLNIYRMSEVRPASGSDLSLVTKWRYYTNWFQNLLLAKDNYKGFATSLIIGDAIRTKFTSFTLDRARFNGIRWDGSTQKNQFTIVSSRVSDPIFMPFDSQVVPVSVGARHEWTRNLFGGHWETEIGDVLRLGATVVNLHQSNSRFDSKDLTIKGVVSVTRPEQIILRFRDDSPSDGFGAVLFAPPIVFVNGERVDISPQEVLAYPASADGSGFFDLTYNIPGDAKSVSFRMIVANDYLIQAAHRYLRSEAAQDTLTTFFQTFVRAPGNVKDQSNKRIEVIDYTLDTGRTIYGINFSANLFGLRVEGEFAQNLSYRKYPVLPGSRFQDQSKAWYVQASRRFGPLTLGGERFNVDPNYFTSLNTYSLERTETYYSGSQPFDNNPEGGVYDWLVDDNDDNDRYPDGRFIWMNNGDGTHSFIFRPTPEEVLNPENPRPDAGIFPGLDENNDGIPDDDQNTNGVPDYIEPFLMYYQDPPRFDIGDDWNNNGVIDVRENDQREDYKYNRDLKGSHIFAQYRPLPGLQLSYGVVRQKQIAGGGRNDINYLKATYTRRWPRWGEMFLYHVSKRVYDDIPDPGYLFNQDALNAFFGQPTFTQDPLSMRNSMVYTSYIGTKITRLPGFHIENNMKYELNRQRYTSFQPQADVSYWAMVNKIDYSWRLWNRLTIMPMFKHRIEKQIDRKIIEGTERENVLRDNQWIMPILRIDFEFTPKTIIRGGFQGISIAGSDLLMNRYRNRINPEASFNEEIFMITVTNASDYGGYKLQFNLGYQQIRTRFLAETAQNKNRDFSRIFVRVIAGW
jgi:hypothetical protein